MEPKFGALYAKHPEVHKTSHTWQYSG